MSAMIYQAQNFKVQNIHQKVILGHKYSIYYTIFSKIPNKRLCQVNRYMICQTLKLHVPVKQQ